MKHKRMVIIGGDKTNDMKKIWLHTWFLLALIILGCKKKFDVFLNNDSRVLNYNAECGSIKLEVSQLRNESFTIYADFYVHETITFNKDSIIVKYKNSTIQDISFEKSPKWPKSIGDLIKEPSVTLNNKDAIMLGFTLRDVEYNYPDTIHVYIRGAFYCKEKPILDIDKINLIIKKKK